MLSVCESVCGTAECGEKRRQNFPILTPNLWLWKVKGILNWIGECAGVRVGVLEGGEEKRGVQVAEFGGRGVEG